MLPLKGKRVILAITGGIAAYKCQQLIRDYVKFGAEVRVVVTPSALRFVSELTLSALSKNRVISDTFDPLNGGTWHINYAEWADIIVVAPATVNTIAKIVNGFADNALTTLLSAKRSPVLVCPAADEDMYNNPVSRKNISLLTELGFFVLDAESGELASGLTGKGRLPDLSKIMDATVSIIHGYSKDLSGMKILITAGPTYEDIDPVRYIGNRSSGKMGFQLAKAAFLRGAQVTLISGPSEQTAYQEINRINVRSAMEMQAAVTNEITANDVIIMAAAVADFRPDHVAAEKIKKSKTMNSINLTENPDILKSIADIPKFKVGFALETNNEVSNAQEKLQSKNLDMIVLNSLKNTEAGFEHDTNAVTVFKKNGTIQELPTNSKFIIAHQILSIIAQTYA